MVLKEFDILNCTCFFCSNNITEEKLHDNDPPEFWEKVLKLNQLCGFMLCSNTYKRKFKILNKLWEFISEVIDDPLSLRVEKLKLSTQLSLTKTACGLAYPCVPSDYYM